MFATMLVSPLVLVLAGVLTAPPVASSGPPARPSSTLSDDVAVPAMQFLASEAIVGLGFLAAEGVRSNDAASFAIMAAIPVAYTLATCGIGRLSVAHRGSCWHAATGTVVGFASGLLLYGLFNAAPGTNPFPREPDSSQEFTNVMGAAVDVRRPGARGRGGRVEHRQVGRRRATAPAARGDAPLRVERRASSLDAAALRDDVLERRAAATPTQLSSSVSTTASESPMSISPVRSGGGGNTPASSCGTAPLASNSRAASTAEFWLRAFQRARALSSSSKGIIANSFSQPGPLPQAGEGHP
jgi:hypothetical protein